MSNMFDKRGSRVPSRKCLLQNVLFLAILVASSVFAQDLTPKATEYKATEYMDAVARVDHFSGAVLMARGGQRVFAHSYGMADWEKSLPNTVNTRFRTGSVTKLFTATAVLMLRDRGKLKINDSVCLYIDACPDSWHGITIRQLLMHYSGIKDDFAELTQMRREHKSPAEFIDAKKRHPLGSAPGTQFHYSNSGYIILGGIISRASGLSYAIFLRKEIFEPLRLKNTDAETSPVPGEAIGYFWEGLRIAGWRC